MPAANRDLAAKAGALADAALPGSLARRAAGCAAVALSTTATLTAARRVLEYELSAGSVRHEALAVLDRLTRESAVA